MGMSSSGTIFFGVYYGEDDPRWPVGEYGREAPDEELPEWDEWLALRAGFIDPWELPEIRELTYDEVQANPELSRLIDIWYEDRKRLASECPVTLLQLGDAEWGYSTYVLALQGTTFSNYQTPAPIPDGHFDQATPEKIEWAIEWCRRRDIDFKDPKWQLGSSRG